MTAVDVACGSCGTALRESARFCDACGAPTAGSGDTANYKQVTVLFADVVGSMDIAAAVDMERLREIMTEVVERSAAMVRRYGGTVEYNGDGVMGLFGAPLALEDHAFRACLAALEIQAEASALAAEVAGRDRVTLRLRVGLNSGRVIAGTIGSGSLGYRAIGSPVGFGERIQSAAPPGGVMVSDSTARLVEHAVMLGEPEHVHVKGVHEPVRIRRLVGIGPPRDGMIGRAEATLIGRRREMTALDATVDGAIEGRGGVVNVVGPAGIGKSRLAREAAAAAAGRGVDVFWTFCESHARDVPFHVVTRLLRAASGVADLDDQAARNRVRVRMPIDADPEDLLLLEDLLGITEPQVALPQIDPDARRRRVTALIKSAWQARAKPALFIVEDAHWIDAVSESMLADFLSVIPRTPSTVLITSRPEYDGPLTRVQNARTIALGPLDDSETSALLGELLGDDPSIRELSVIIAERATGNPFFAEEMVRELAQRGVLTGDRGAYICRTDAADVAVPATVQAAIAARIDRLDASTRQTLDAASVIGARFGADLLDSLGIDAVVDELLAAELVDQVRFTPNAEYVFRHPLIRAVVYESQLKSHRAQWHRRVATAIQASSPDTADQNSAVIAEHYEAAGEAHAAYGWHMRAAAWATDRDIGAARVSWERARRLADALPADDSDQMPMRVAPRTMLCATAWQARAVEESRGRFEELRELCTLTGDKVSLAIGMSGLATELLYAGRSREGSQLASEQMALLESMDDPTPIMGLAIVAFLNWSSVGRVGEILRWSQTIIDLAAGDPAKGAGFGIGSPLAAAVAWRGIAQYWLGRPGWREDLHTAVAIARSSDPATFGLVVAWIYGGIFFGVLRPDDSAMRVIEEAVQIAEGARNYVALGLAEATLGVALLHRDSAADRQRGLELMMRAREWQCERAPSLVPVTDLLAASERFSRDNGDGAVSVMRDALDNLLQAGRFGYALMGTRRLVEALLQRGADRDLTEAQEAIDRLANLPTDTESAMRDITLLRLRALMARAHGDIAYPDLVIRYRTMAEALGFEGHIAWAEAMTAGEPG